MSIAAVIERVTWNDDGTATMHLGPLGNDGPGQNQMTVENPPPNFESCVGTKVWGGAGFLMVGETHWADRLGYERCRLRTTGVCPNCKGEPEWPSVDERGVPRLGTSGLCHLCQGSGKVKPCT